jgi:hypothetical protein
MAVPPPIRRNKCVFVFIFNTAPFFQSKSLIFYLIISMVDFILKKKEFDIYIMRNQSTLFFFNGTYCIVVAIRQ